MTIFLVAYAWYASAVSRRSAVMDVALVRIYLSLFALAVSVWFMYLDESVFAAFPVFILTLPWSALAALPVSFLGVTVPGTFLMTFFFGYLNARLLHRLGKKLE
jgi:hypothetical protein